PLFRSASSIPAPVAAKVQLFPRKNRARRVKPAGLAVLAKDCGSYRSGRARLRPSRVLARQKPRPPDSSRPLGGGLDLRPEIFERRFKLAVLEFRLRVFLRRVAVGNDLQLP